jgi:hypothetical protein
MRQSLRHLEPERPGKVAKEKEEKEIRVIEAPSRHPPPANRPKSDRAPSGAPSNPGTPTQVAPPTSTSWGGGGQNYAQGGAEPQPFGGKGKGCAQNRSGSSQGKGATPRARGGPINGPQNAQQLPSGPPGACPVCRGNHWKSDCPRGPHVPRAAVGGMTPPFAPHRRHPIRADRSTGPKGQFRPPIPRSGSSGRTCWGVGRQAIFRTNVLKNQFCRSR